MFQICYVTSELHVEITSVVFFCLLCHKSLFLVTYIFANKKCGTVLMMLLGLGSEALTCASENVASNINFLLRFRNLRCQRSLKYIAPKIWNNILLEIKSFSFLKFKKQFKKHLVEKYKRD